MEDSDESRQHAMQHYCRICSVDFEPHNLYPLSENEELTEIGEMFRECLHLDVLSAEGYPDKICNHCQLQLKLFHAFLSKAVKSHDNFTEAIEGLMADDVLQEIDIKTEEYSEQNDDEECFVYDVQSGNGRSATHHAILVEDSVADMQGGTAPGNDDFSIEYLDQEYQSTFDNETTTQPVSTVPEVRIKSPPIHKPRTRVPKRKSTRPTGSAPKRKYPFECQECAKGFLHKEIYEAHERSVHQGLPAFSCQHCKKTFNEKPNFDYHMQDHNNHRPAQCHLCEKSFKNKQDLNSHLRVHNDIRKYMCDQCGKRFRSQSHMVYHRYSHFDARNFHCDKCDQSFKSPHILKTHKNTIHSDIYKYTCLECGKKFKRDHHLVAHKRTHDSDRPRKTRRLPNKVKVETQENAENIDEEILHNDDGGIIVIIAESE